MAEKQDISDTESIKEELGLLLSKRSKDIFPSKFRRFLIPIIPDPNQLSIPSEPTVRGDFTSRLPEPRQTIESFMVEQSMRDKGNEIVLNSILKQLKSLPSIRDEKDKFTFPGLDIMRFGSEEDIVSELDLILGRIRTSPDTTTSGLAKKDI